MSLGKMIATIRTIKGMSQRDLAAASGVNGSYISEFETGKRNLDNGEIAAIEAALGVRFDEIKSDFDALAKKVK